MDEFAESFKHKSSESTSKLSRNLKARLKVEEKL